jgi:hypothetical protein
MIHSPERLFRETEYGAAIAAKIGLDNDSASTDQANLDKREKFCQCSYSEVKLCTPVQTGSNKAEVGGGGLKAGSRHARHGNFSPDYVTYRYPTVQRKRE